MTEQELDSFLAKVRHARLVDYLDPLGETAQNAFERRLSWARVTQHDPAYADEARFLLDNADALRDVLREELVEDDWVEDASAGSEFGGGGPVARRNLLTERERVTTVFGTDDLSDDEAENTRSHLARAAAGYDPDDEPTTVGPHPSISPSGKDEDETLVSFDDDPDDVLTAVGPASGPDNFPELDEDDVDPFDAPTTVGPPAASRVAPPAAPEPTAELSEFIEVEVLQEDGDETLPPGYVPPPGSFEEAATQAAVPPSGQPTGPMVEFEETRELLDVPSYEGSSPEVEEASEPGPAFGRSPTPLRRVALHGLPARLPGRLPELRRSTPPPQRSTGLWAGLALALIGFGFVAVAGVGLVLYALSGPDEALTIERLDEPSDVAVDVDEATAAAEDDPPADDPPDRGAADDDPLRSDSLRDERPRDDRPTNDRPTNDRPTNDRPINDRPRDEPLRDDRASDDVGAGIAARPPTPAVEPEPEPTRPPVPPTPEPPVAVEVPSPEPPAPADPPSSSPSSSPPSSPSADLARLDGSEAVEAAPAAAPAPEPEPPEPAPPAAAEPVANLVPPPPAPADAGTLDVTGVWIGAGDGKSFTLTISSQDGTNFRGTVELQVDDGGWLQSGVAGNVDGESIRFSGDALTFRGTVSKTRAKGTYTTEAGGAEKAWTLIR